jgi:hypothetical protein
LTVTRSRQSSNRRPSRRYRQRSRPIAVGTRRNARRQFNRADPSPSPIFSRKGTHAMTIYLLHTYAVGEADISAHATKDERDARLLSFARSVGYTGADDHDDVCTWLDEDAGAFVSYDFGTQDWPQTDGMK